MPEGRIVKALSGFYYVQDGQQLITCRGRGRFRKDEITPLVGDFVTYKAETTHEGYVLEIHGRKNELVRPPIVNIDQALLVFSAIEPDFSTHLLNRFLVLVEYHHIQPIIVITKMDLLDESRKLEVNNQLETYRKMGYIIFCIHPKDTTSVEPLTQMFKGKVTTVAGQTGVGKSSLLNTLSPELQLKTGEISKSLGRGKHTTRHVELLPIYDGLVADTPGFSSLEIGDVTIQELRVCFPDFVKYQDECKFRECTHINEPKCSVKDHVQSGEIAQQRYKDYVAFVQEIKERKPRY